MKTVNTEQRLEYARAGVAVLKALKLTDRTIRYNEFGRAISLIGEDEDWQVWHRDQISDTLNLIAATERLAGLEGQLEFQRLVGADGEPGSGVYKTSRIVTS